MDTIPVHFLILFPLIWFAGGGLIYAIFCKYPLGKGWIATEQKRISKEGELPEIYEVTQYTKKENL